MAYFWHKCRFCIYAGCISSLFYHLWIISLVFLGESAHVNAVISSETDHMLAAFQQTFRFTYTKLEEGSCSDLDQYRELLAPVLDVSVTYLPSLCPVEGTGDRLSGQLTISDIAEYGQNIHVNVSLMFEYDPRQNTNHEQCKSRIQTAFEQDDGQVTSSLRGTFFPLYCPAISTDTGGELVYAGFICRSQSRIRVQLQPPGTSQPIDVCVFCPLGQEVTTESEKCTECQQGFYKAVEDTPSCEPCPEEFVTRINGSTTKDDCQLRACYAGSYADVFQGGQCLPCPYGKYQPSKWTEQCLDCPAGFTTYHVGADSLELCLLDCLPGEEYSDKTQSCQPCPIGYFNDDIEPSRFSCILCHEDYITESTGATSNRDCAIRNCTKAGQYHDIKDNICRDCPQGQWQNLKWQTSCNPCKDGMTTASTGTTHPAYCYVVEEEAGLKFTKEEIILTMVTVLVVLLIGNCIIIVYCLYNRKHNQTETLNSMDEPGALKVLSRRESWDYQDIEVYDIIRDVLPQLSEQTGTSTFQPQDGSSASSADYDKNKCLKSSCDAINVKQLDPVHLEGSDSSSDETVYDDVINTCPIYQNFGSRSPLADLTDEIWSSRVDVLY